MSGGAKTVPDFLGETVGIKVWESTKAKYAAEERVSDEEQR